MKLNDLDVLIPQYAENKSEMDSYKKICDKENAQIKSIMKDFVVEKYEDEYNENGKAYAEPDFNCREREYRSGAEKSRAHVT